MRISVVVVGSAESQRTYDPPLRDAEQATKAAEELGCELARQGCSIVVHSGDHSYIEGPVVRGYIASGCAEPKSILVRSRYGRRDDLSFPELAEHRDYFDIMPESTSDWEVTYYRSLCSADAILLLGGGRSTFTAGLIAIAQRIPLMAVAAFGGNAEKVWRRLGAELNWAEKRELAQMSESWRPGLADDLVAGLLSQHDRRGKEAALVDGARSRAARQFTWGLLSTAVTLVLAIATVPFSYGLVSGSTASVALLVIAPLLASTCGAIARNTLDNQDSWLRSAVLGAGAGTMTFLLFVAAQLTINPGALDDHGSVSRLLYFVIPLAFVAGLTFDAVYRKLRKQDVTSSVSVLDQPPS